MCRLRKRRKVSSAVDFFRLSVWLGVDIRVSTGYSFAAYEDWTVIGPLYYSAPAVLWTNTLSI